MKKLFLLLLIALFCFTGNAKTFETLTTKETSEVVFKEFQQERKPYTLKATKGKTELL